MQKAHQFFKDFFYHLSDHLRQRKTGYFILAFVCVASLYLIYLHSNYESFISHKKTSPDKFGPVFGFDYFSSYLLTSFYSVDAKGAIHLGNALMQIFLAACMLIAIYTLYITKAEASPKATPKNATGETHGKDHRVIEVLATTAIPLLVSSLLSIAYAPFYLPLVSFLAIAAIVLAGEHLGAIGSIPSIYRDLQDAGAQIKSATQSLNLLRNREGLADWRKRILDCLAKGYTILGSVREWDIDKITLDVSKKMGKQSNMTREAFLEEIRKQKGRSDASLNLLLSLDKRSAVDKAHSSAAKVTFLAPVPSSPLSVVDGYGSSDFVDNFTGLLVQILYARDFNAKCSEGGRVLFLMASRAPWQYVISSDFGGDVAARNGLACQLVSSANRASYATDITCDIDERDPFSLDGDVKSDSINTVAGVDEGLRNLARRHIPLEVHINTVLLLDFCHGTHAKNEAELIKKETCNSIAGGNTSPLFQHTLSWYIEDQLDKAGRKCGLSSDLPPSTSIPTTLTMLILRNL